MTANELADKCNRLQGEIILGFLADCATMLRQQAKEIESLKLRELTDEEIMKIYDREELYNIDEGQMYIKPIDFARAILRKASEK